MIFLEFISYEVLPCFPLLETTKQEKKDMDGFTELYIDSNTCKQRAAVEKCNTFET